MVWQVPVLPDVQYVLNCARTSLLFLLVQVVYQGLKEVE